MVEPLSNDKGGPAVASSPDEAVYTTAEGLEEKAKLQRHFRRLDMLLFTVCALVGLDTLGQVSGFGAATFSWLVILAIFFLFPYALIMAELGTTFTQEGGPYEWMKMAWGRAWGGVGAVLYWVTNPLWVGGSLAFIATAAWSTYLHPIGTGSVGDYAFKTIFIWISIIVAIISLKRGKWIPNIGAIVRIGVLAFFSITVVIYAIEHGVHGYAAGKFNPFQLTAFLGLVPLLLFNYVGFELQNGAAEEMENPQKDVPGTVIQGGAISTLAYCIPVFGILAVLPASKITGIGGFLDAVSTTFGVYGERRALPHPGDGRRVHLRARDVGQRLDDGLRPDPGGRGVRRRVLPVVRQVQRSSRDAGARERPLGCRVDALHDRRGQPQLGLEREHLPRGALPGHVDDAPLLPVDLPVGAQAALQPPPHRASVPRSRRHGRHVDHGAS